MRNTIGIGITTSIGQGLEVAVQKSVVYDAKTGQWHYVVSTLSGVSGGVLPADISLDIFVLKEKLGVDSLAGAGGYSGVSIITQAGLIYGDTNGDGVADTVIGAQGGWQTNLSYGVYVSNTTVYPISEIPTAEFNAIKAAALAGLIGFGLSGGLAALVGIAAASALINIVKDPLILDLDGDGIELISLANSNAHLDYGGDGFAERTGWVKADDGILVFDRNANGSVDGIGEMFGSATQDGFEVLQTLDTNRCIRTRAPSRSTEHAARWLPAMNAGMTDCTKRAA